MGRELNPPPPPPDSPLDALKAVINACEGLADWIDWISVTVDSAKQELGDVAQKSPGSNPVPQPVKAKAHKVKPDARPSATFARSIDLKWGPKYAELDVDGRVVHLSRKLGLLAELLLTDDEAASPPARAGWRSREELARRLGERAGSEVKKHTLENLIWRLKDELKSQTGLVGLVECGGPLGVRFALLKFLLEADHDSGEETKPPDGP